MEGLVREIEKSKISEFLKYLNKTYDIFLPQRKGKDWVFAKFDSETEISDLKPVLTILPLKKFFFPNDETLYHANKNDELFFSPKSTRPIAIVGVNSFDIKALAILDQIMSKPTRDPYYWAKRKNSLIIGVGPERINIANVGYDIFLEDLGKSFLAIAASEKGISLTRLKFFDKSNKTPKKIISFSDPILGQTDKIQEKLEKGYDSKVWQKVASTCFGCGICAYVCPLCYCHEMDDQFCNNDCKSCQTRKWDACFLPEFFQVAGHNPRENLANRIYNWYYHKFVRMPKEYGQIGCVDCGRCIEYCPAKINFKEVLKELLK